MRFPGYQDTAFFDKDGKEVPFDIEGALPKGWKRISFEDSAKFINGFAFKPTDWKKEGIPIIKIAELKGGVTKKTPRNNGKNVPEHLHVKQGDILFSWSADLNTYIWNEGNGLLNQHIFKVVPYEGISKGIYFILFEK